MHVWESLIQIFTNFIYYIYKFGMTKFSEAHSRLPLKCVFNNLRAPIQLQDIASKLVIKNVTFIPCGTYKTCLISVNNLYNVVTMQFFFQGNLACGHS